MIDEIVEILPCYQDCEKLLHFLFQEADLYVFCTHPQYLHPIWSRFVCGGRVTTSEAMLLMANLATAAALLHETPHILYRLDEPAQALHLRLIKYIWQYVEDTDKWKHDVFHIERSRLDLVLLVGLLLDHTRLSGQRSSGKWPVMRTFYNLLNKHTGFLDPNAALWDDVNNLEGELVRRVIWNIILCERWGRLVADSHVAIDLHPQSLPFPLPSKLDASLSSPLTPFPAERTDGHANILSRLRQPAKRLPQIFRMKMDEEHEQNYRWLLLQISLSQLALDVGEYVTSVVVWKEESSQAPLSTRRQESLLHLGTALCKEISDWKEALPVDCKEPNIVDADDYLQIRAASMASILNIGLHRLVVAVTLPWLSANALESPSSTSVTTSLISRLQSTAFTNAHEMAQRIGSLRSLKDCGYAVYFGSWAATALYRAATILAMPLVGHIKSNSDDNQNGSKNVLYDRLSALEPTSKQSQSLIIFPELYSCAHDIFSIIDVLPLFNTNPLGAEAIKRLRHIARDHNFPLQSYPSPISDHNGMNGSINRDFRSSTAAVSSLQDDALVAEEDQLRPLIKDHAANSQKDDQLIPSTNDAWLTNDFAGLLDSLFAMDRGWWDSILKPATS